MENVTNVTIMMPEETEEIKEVKLSTRSLCKEAMVFKVNSIESFEKSTEIVTLLNSAKKKVSGSFSNMLETVKKAKAAAEEARKAAVNLHDTAIKPFEVAGQNLKTQRIAFQNEQERLRRIEEQKERERLEREAEKERKRLQDIADRAEARAKKLEEEGKAEQAELARQKAEENKEASEDVYVEPVAIESKIARSTKTDNGTTYTVKTLEVTLPETKEDIIACCKAIAEGSLPHTIVKFSLNRLKEYGKMNELKGKHHGVFFKENIDERIR